ncbi:ATP-binding protein [Treponema phagedenis]|uniref:ATP-binding protein n=1 Tax=Treponema phagedenis TaxID=162 RepID=UPI001652E3A7|nr:hypothetical protein C5O78_10800 [Treponema phagedenis]
MFCRSLQRNQAKLVGEPKVDYGAENGIIDIAVKSRDEKISISITDYGKGFSHEDLQKSKQQFYRGDKSRNSPNHFGIGLYIADQVAKQHQGNLSLSNCTHHPGAEVEISIPIN